MHERTLSTRRAFEGRLLRVDVVDVELDDGTRSVREIVRHPGAAVILAQTPDGRFVLVRQFRKAAEAVLLEAVAGTLDPGEDPATCARRELEEETGYRARRVYPLGRAYPAPGYTEELLHFFLAETDAEARACRPDHDERIDVMHITGDELDGMVRRGEIVDAKTLALWLLYKNRQGEEA